MSDRKPTFDRNSTKILDLQFEENLPAVTSSKQQIRRMLELRPFTYEELDAAKIIYPAMKDTSVLNTFRELRTKLMQKAGKNNFSLMVSSLVENGGSTYVSQNLAAAFALDFEKTALLVECDKSNRHKENLLFSPPDFGITDYLDDSTLSVSDIIYATGVPRLRKIPIGNLASGKSELFLSDRMEGFVEEIKNRYADRFIIMDAPPIATSADSRILAELCDYSLLVIPYGRATKLQISAGINSIPKNKLAGVVFNN